ncbi:hypothetical protein ES319_D03G065400v1 [Gossypium barbadense]|uniref:Major facilitator superfamily (MFS) profile domain-containing protein n=1 Tax=Gossypium barbadense TaxID=3634 RepID=A0A5J5S4B3_GOSBA|nr:hypothetical protein ES319_D03G065400v1 [Gossypium barbadense]
MRGRHADAYSIYKRGTRDYINAYDKEQVRSLNGVSKEIGNPSWKRSFLYILVASLASFLYGYHLGVINETLESISNDLHFNGNTMAEGLVVSICLGGGFLGSTFSGLIVDRVGFRRAFQLCALPMIIGSSMSATAKNLSGMLLGRLFVGTGMGLGPTLATLYVTEVSPAYVRGTYGSFTQIATSLGLMSSLLIGFPAKETEGWWRICFWVSAVPAALLALFMEFSPESPHWLFKSANISVGIANFLGSFAALLLMDKLGRKVLLIGSFSGMVVAMGLQAASASSLVSSSNEVYLSVGGMLLFVLAFSVGAGPVPSLLLSEMFMGRIRAKAMSVCLASHWVVNFFVGLLFLRLLEQIGPLVLNTIFATFCLVAVIFVKRNVLETKGKSLQEIKITLLPPE